MLVVIHVGLHKTGTSAIQEWLDRNADALSPEVYSYNLRDGSAGPLKGACHRYVVGHHQGEQIRRVCRWMRRQMLLLKPDRICITDEGIAGVIPGWTNGGYRERELYPKADSIAAIIAEEFKEFEVRFVVYYRDRTDWLRSCWDQMKREGRYIDDQSRYMDEFAKLEGWVEFNERIKATVESRGAQFHAYDYETEFLRDSVFEMGVIRNLEIPKPYAEVCSTNLRVINRSATRD